jgi:hypothetical protein
VVPAERGGLPPHGAGLQQRDDPQLRVRTALGDAELRGQLRAGEQVQGGPVEDDQHPDFPAPVPHHDQPATPHQKTGTNHEKSCNLRAVVSIRQAEQSCRPVLARLLEADN